MHPAGMHVNIGVPSLLVNIADSFAHFSWVLWLMNPSLFTSMSSKRTVVLSCAAGVPDWSNPPIVVVYT